MKLNPSYVLTVLLCLVLSATAGKVNETVALSQNASQQKSVNYRKPVPSRSFRFHYAVIIDKLKPKTKTRIWIPLAKSNKHQEVKILEFDLPGTYRRTKENKYGNRILYLEATADERGEIPLEVVYDVTRFQVTLENAPKIEEKDRKQFLKQNKLVPIDGKPFELLLNGTKPMGAVQDIARILYDKVDSHVKYAKPLGGKWGRGDATWVCDSKYGNCTDFHSLFISLCRTSRIPAKFEIGFPIPTKKGAGKVGGYHCWAYYAEGKAWRPVDISEADKHPKMKDFYFGNLTANRFSFSTGRDLILEPKQKSGPLNFFIYPHVEVNGEVHKNFQKRFRYRDNSTGMPPSS